MSKDGDHSAIEASPPGRRGGGGGGDGGDAAPLAAEDLWHVLEALPGPYLLIGRDHRVVAASDSYLSLAGLIGDRERKQVEGVPLAEAFCGGEESARQELEASLRRVAERGEAEMMAVRRGLLLATGPADGRGGEGADPADRYWRAHNLPVRVSGKVKWVLHQLEDVTEHVEAQERARRSEREVDEVLDRIGEIFLAVDREWKVTHLNKAALSYGPERSEVIGRSLWEISPQLAETEMAKRLKKAMRTGQQVELEMKGPSTQRWFEVSVYPSREGLAIFARDVHEKRRAEEALQARDRELTQTLERIGDAFTAVDREWRITYINPRGARYADLPPAELIGRSMWEVFPGLRGTDFEHQCREAMRGQKAVRIEQTGPTTGRWFETMVYPSPDGLSMYSRDIHDQKLAEQSARESESRFRLMADSAPVLIWLADTSGRGNWFNKPWLEFTGRTMEEEREVGWTQGVHPDDRERCDPICREALQRREPFQVDYRLRRHDGEWRWVQDHGLPLFGPDGEFTGFIGSCVDITQRKKAEHALRESESRLRFALDAAEFGDWDLDLATGKAHRSLRHDRIFGYEKPLREWTYDLFLQHVVPQDRSRVDSAFRDAMKRESDWQFECRIRRADGVVRWIEAHGSPYRDAGGRVVRLLGIVSDITARKEAEQERTTLLQRERAARAEAEDANRSKDRFLAALSHELRTPLSPVLLAVSLLEQRTDLPEEVASDIQTIRRNVEMEARLIDDLLDITRIVTGKMRMQFENSDLHLIIRRAADICCRDREAGIDLALQARRHFVHADPARIQQVLWNLLNNAVKFTPPQGRIVVRTRDLDDGRIRVEVSDTGIGMEPELLPRLFHAFEQGTVTGGFGGLGLGLSISHALMRVHRGTLKATSPGAGKGSTFTIEMPSYAPTPTGKTPAPQPGARHGALHVLLVEDHQATLELMGRLLARAGHEMASATSVNEGLRLAKEREFDLLISDLGLPDGSGHELVRKLRKQGQKMPAIALSGYGMEEDVRRSREAGFDEHLTKPVDVGQLREAIRRVIDGG